MPRDTDAALEALCEAAARTQRLLDDALRRASVLKEQRALGRSYADIVRAEDRPLIVELVSDALVELAAAGAAFRRAEARALHDEGLSQEAIARLFGVTRQRVGALLRRDASADPAE